MATSYSHRVTAEARRILGLSCDEAEELFYNVGASRKQVVKVLRHAAKTGVIDWSVA